MIFQAPTSFNPWSIATYRWSEPILWICAISALFFGLFLFASYLKNRKKNLLLWTFAVLGIWIFYHQLIASGTWTMLVGSFTTSLFGLYTAMLLALIPGLLAAGLCYDKDKKFGMIYTLYVLVLSVVYLFMLCAPNIGLIDDAPLIGFIALMLVQIPSAVLLIALPIMKEGKFFPKFWITVGGVFMLTANIMLAIIPIMVTIGAPMTLLDGGGIDLILMIVPFFIGISMLSLFYGIIGTKDYGFDVAHVEFEE